MTDDELDRLLDQELETPNVPAQLQAQLWSGIEAELQTPVRRSLAPWLMAAAVVLLNVFGLMTLDPAVSSVHPTLSGLPSSDTWAPRDEALLPAEDDLQTAVVALQQAYARRRSDLDPALLAVYDKNLATIGDAVDQSRAALVQHPGDAHLQRMLRHAYDRQLSLLVRATGVRR
ncbi:MAG: hypothetical protein ACRBN8_25170 [Nannocystales bacterium]